MSNLEVFNSCPVGVLALNKDNQVVYTNPEFSRTYGFSMKDFTNDTLLTEIFELNDLSNKTYINDVSSHNIRFYDNKSGVKIVARCSHASYNDLIIVYFNPVLIENYFCGFTDFPNEVIAFTKDQEVIFQNKTSVKHLGDIRNQRITESTDIPEYQIWSRLISKAARKQTSVNQVFTNSDSEKTNRILCLPIYFSGELLIYTIVKLDISDTWTTRKEEYLSQLKLLMEASNIYFVLRDLKTQEIEYVSPYFKKLWREGINTENLDFNSLLQYSEEDYEIIKLKYRNHLSGNAPFLHEIRLCNSDGEMRWVKLKMGFIANNNGEKTKEYWILEDISNERALKYIIKNRETTISRIQKAINNKIGKENLDHLNYYLAEALGAEIFFMGERISESTIKVVSGYSAHGFNIDNYEYSLDKTPCGEVVKNGFQIYRENVNRLFPEDTVVSRLSITGYLGVDLQNNKGENIGILAGLFKKPIKDPQFAKTLVNLFSSRAEAELQRLSLDRYIKEREDRFAHALEVGEFGVIDIDLVERKYNFNEQFIGIADLDEEAAINPPPGILSSLIHPDCKEGFYAMRNELYSGSSDIAEFEWKILTKKRKTKWINGKHKVITKTPDGMPKRVLSIFKDVTQIREAEDKIRLSLKREKELNKKLIKSEIQLKSKVSALNKLNKKLKISEARWSYALEGNGDTVWDLDLKNWQLYLSEKFHQFLGTINRNGKANLKNFLNRIHPDHYDELATEINHGIYEPFPAIIKEVLIKSNTDEYIWMLIRGKVVEFTEEDNIPLRMVGTITDMSNIKMMKRELSIYEEMIKQNQNSIMLTDLDGYIDFMNTTAFELLKYKQHEILYKPLHIFNSDRNKFTYNLIENVLEEGHWSGQVSMKNAFGELLDVNIIASLLKDDQDAPYGIVINIDDITEKAKLEKSIVQLEKEKLNNELNHQKELTEVMIKVQEAEKAKLAKELHDGIGQALNLVKLKSESIDTGNFLSIPDKMFEINSLLGQTIKDLKHITYELMPMSLQQLGLEGSIHLLLNNYKSIFNSSTKIKSKIKLGEDIKITDSVSAHIYRITQESINNSVKYARASQFSLMLMNIKDKLHLVIEDNGVGFDYHEAYKKHHSYGLKNIEERAKLINGRLLIDTAPGRGYTLSLTVPLEQ